MKLREAWPAIEAMASNPDHRHVAIIEDCLRGRPELKVTTSCCNRKVPEHVTVEDAHTISTRHHFHEFGQGAFLAASNEALSAGRP